jgi:hypothetical protein
MNATGDNEGAFGISPAISTSATAAEFSAGLAGMVWSGLQEGDTFKLSNEFFEVFKPDASAAVWAVRFFFAPASDGLLITVLGDVPPLKQYNSRDTTVVVSVNDDVTGVVPESAMPISAVANAASAGTKAVETASVVETTAAEVVKVSHVCGNGLRTTAEGCDDGDLVDGVMDAPATALSRVASCARPTSTKCPPATCPKPLPCTSRRRPLGLSVRAPVA